MSSIDWKPIWTWSLSTPPPNDPSFMWSESIAIPPGYGSSCLKWHATGQPSNGWVGRFYNGPSIVGSSYVRGSCAVNVSNGWLGNSGIFLGNADQRSGNAYGPSERNNINGLLFSPQGPTSGGGGILVYCHVISKGVVSSLLGSTAVPAVASNFIQFEGCLLMDNTNFSLGGYNNGVLDSDRPIGEPITRAYIRFGTSPILDLPGSAGWIGWIYLGSLSFSPNATMLTNMYKGNYNVGIATLAQSGGWSYGPGSDIYWENVTFHFGSTP